MKKRNLSMNQIMILSLTAIVVAILAFALVFFLQMYQDSLIQNAQTDGRRTISQVSSTVDSYLDDMNAVMELLAEELVTPSEDRDQFFETFLQIRSDVVAVTIYDETGNLMNCYSLGHEVRPVVLENLSFDRTKRELYQDGYVSAPHVMSLFEGYYPWVVTIVRPVDAGEWEKWVAVDISCTNISSYINGIGIGQRGYCFLEDMDGNIVYHPQQQLIYSDLKTENIGLISTLDDGSHVIGTMIYTVQTLDSGSWRVVGVSFVQDIITDSLHEIARLLVIAAIGIIAATLAISVLFSRVLSRPIHGLISAMEAFEKNADNYVYEPVSGAREVQDLSSSFDHLVRKILEPDRLIAVFLQILQLFFDRLRTDEQVPIAPFVIAHGVIHQNRHIDIFRGLCKRQLFCKIRRSVFRRAGNKVEGFCRPGKRHIGRAVLQKRVFFFQLVRSCHLEDLAFPVRRKSQRALFPRKRQVRALCKFFRIHIKRSFAFQRRHALTKQQHLFSHRKRLWLGFRFWLFRLNGSFCYFSRFHHRLRR